ncbi:YadA-like family protein [Photobacterium sanguinicancri]|uniref:YadA-like family protein n=1 Tax=Photobacterium sanguinicancri TaxID=875932 RepID=UPI003D0984AF
MKKSIIALTVLASLASTSAFATGNSNVDRRESVFNEIKTLIQTGKKVKVSGYEFNRDNISDWEKMMEVVGEDNAKRAADMINEAATRGHVKVTDDTFLPDDEKTNNKVIIEEEKTSRTRNDAQINGNTNRISDLEKEKKAAESIVAKEYTAAAKHVAKQDARITTLESDFSKMAERQDALEKRVDKVEKKMDGVMAGVHAVTNARPFVQNGQTAVGVGTGFAGSAQSVAIGAAHSFDDSAWSMSASMNVTTGSGVKTDVSGGVGAHYVF